MKQPMKTPSRITSRPFFSMTGALGALACYYLLSSVTWPSFVSPMVYPGIGITLLAYTLYTLITFSWGGITADETGLRWRDWRGAHFVAWADVTTYYDALPRFAQGRTEQVRSMVVLAGDGTVLRFDLQWWNGDRLRAWIAEKAISVASHRLPDGTSGWIAQGARPSDLPQTFSYSRIEIRNERLQASCLTFAVCCAILGPFAWLFSDILGGLSATASSFRDDWYSEVSSILLGFSLLLLACVSPFFWHFSRSERARRDADKRVRRTESLQVTAEGLTFFIDGEERFASWESIVGYHFGSPLKSGSLFAHLFFYSRFLSCHIRTTDGKRFVLTNRISRFPLLQYILRRYATEAVEENLVENNREALGGIAARWTGGEEGNGDHVYHMRTRTFRNSLCSMAFVSAIFLTVLISEWLSSPYLESMYPLARFILMTLTLISVAGTILTSGFYWFSRVTVGRRGVLLTWLGKDRFVPWSAVQQMENISGTLYLTVESESPLQITPTGYAFGTEIERRIEECLRQYSRRAQLADQ